MNRKERKALKKDSRHPEGNVIDSRRAGDDGGDTLGRSGTDTSNESPLDGIKGEAIARANAAKYGIPTRTPGDSLGNPNLIPGTGGAAGGSSDRVIESSADIGAESGIRGSDTIIPETGTADTTGGTASTGNPVKEDNTHGEKDRREKYRLA